MHQGIASGLKCSSQSDGRRRWRLRIKIKMIENTVHEIVAELNFRSKFRRTVFSSL